APVRQTAGTLTWISVLLLMSDGPMMIGAAPTNVTDLMRLRFLPVIRAITGTGTEKAPTSLISDAPIVLLVGGPTAPVAVRLAVPVMTGEEGGRMVSSSSLGKSSTKSLPPGLITVMILQGVRPTSAQVPTDGGVGPTFPLMVAWSGVVTTVKGIWS